VGKSKSTTIYSALRWHEKPDGTLIKLKKHAHKNGGATISIRARYKD
jgi:hypothetical protein